MKKIKIINDPVSGFIRISGDLISQIIEHEYFQRLRRIKQLGFTNLVYPGANHTRFEHALGAYQLMSKTIQYLIQKGTAISDEENEALLAAILLHDIGHGPFSHALEQSIVENISHEELSLIFMDKLNIIFKSRLDLAIKMYMNKYHRPFFHQLINSQLDIDRLDYLRRDSFYTGVAEGNVGSERIISIINVKDGNLVIENKGIHSIEKFLMSRRLMYWQVYLHKTVISAEQLLLKILIRAKHLARLNHELYCSPSLKFFLYKDIKLTDLNKSNILNNFASLDDFDIYSAIKVWAENDDPILKMLCKNLVYRKLFKTEISDTQFSHQRIAELMRRLTDKYNIEKNDADYFVFSDSVRNYFYDIKGSKINVLLGDEKVVDISNTLSGFNLTLSIDPMERFFLCYPKSLAD